jgi:hypothetical protein
MTGEESGRLQSFFRPDAISWNIGIPLLQKKSRSAWGKSNKIEKGESVTAPGAPKNYPDAKKLVTEDCIKPASTN